jgi:SAM-dependent methyltransferase
VVDVGCGVGTWAMAFKDRGCNVIGLDGDYVREEDLYISPDEFRAVDLNHPPTGELGTFDLAVSLEVAEHLKPSSEARFLDFLASLAPSILFSAAIPGQGGKGHFNEQWQSHWIAEFHSRGMACLDVVRPEVWNNPAVKPWYAQNTFLFSRADKDEMAMPADVIHPGTFMRAHKNPSVVRESLTTKVLPQP